MSRPAAITKPSPEALPVVEDLHDLATEVRACARHAQAFDFLRDLTASPPQSLLLEGGTARERAVAALYWALVLNCEAAGAAKPGSAGGNSAGSASAASEASLSLFADQETAPQRTSPGIGQASGSAPGQVTGLTFGSAPGQVIGLTSGPCYTCPTCLRFLGRMHRDFFYLDGLAGTIAIDDVRAVRAVLGEAPREAKYRVVVLAEAQALSEPAANAMLKSLEEVRSATVFVLLAPQRERLLPTLVSRSWVLTLAWPDPHNAPENSDSTGVRDWAACAMHFLRTGQGLFERTGARTNAATGGGMDAAAAQTLILACQQALVQALAGDAGQQPLASFFAALPENRQRMADAILAEGQDSILAKVNPGLVADWIMTRLYLLQPRR